MKFYYIPKWATYIAYDGDDRHWYAYECRPNLHEGTWIYEGKREEVYPHLIETLGPIKGRDEK